MIRVVDLGFGGLSTTNLRIFRYAGLRTGWGCTSIRFTISKIDKGIYVIS